MKANLKNKLIVKNEHPSGRSSPVFPWSPLPQKRHLNFIEKKNILTKSVTDLYPNCDSDVWLRSCEKEILEPLEGSVSGVIPEWLQGTLIRNGPGSLKVGSEYFAHLFDSSALLHRFFIGSGKITYQCKFIETNVYKTNQAAQRIVLTDFGTVGVPDPCQTTFQKVAAVFSSKPAPDNSMISVYPFGDELYAFGETPVIHKINPQTLATEETLDLRTHVTIVHHTSHPHVMNDGSVYNLGMSVHALGPYYSIIRFPRGKDDANMFEKAEIVANVPARWPLHPSYMHTFGVTENYFVIVEQPLSLSVPAIVSSRFVKNEPLAGCFRWYHEEKTQINVICRKTGTRKHVFLADAFFYLHIINQFEKDGCIFLDVCAYRDPAMLDCMYIENLKSMQRIPEYAKMFRGRPVRFVLPLNQEKSENLLVKPHKLCNLGCETPRINYEHFLGKTYRFFYAISSDVDAKNPGTIIKVDVESKKSLTWCEENCYPSEPIFVPKPNAKNEDDGVVLAAMVWGKTETNKVGLLILDAKTFKELGRAVFETPSPVPKCLHGWFLPQNPL